MEYETIESLKSTLKSTNPSLFKRCNQLSHSSESEKAFPGNDCQEEKQNREPPTHDDPPISTSEEAHELLMKKRKQQEYHSDILKLKSKVLFTNNKTWGSFLSAIGLMILS